MKRPWLMAAWPLLWILYSSAILTAVVDSNKSKNNDARLKVSIRKDTMLGVPSCQHTFSQIELLNMHSSEPIMIYSIQTEPEETVLVKPESSPTLSPSNNGREPEYGRSWSGSDIPQQLHVSKLPSKSLSLGPGQVAIVPVTFLPRYPSVGNCDDSDQESSDDDADDYYATTTDGRSPPPLSPTAKLDLVDLVGEGVLKVIDNKRQHLRHTLDPTYRRRNNISPESLPKGDEQYDVTTTVIVDTSRGVVKLPIAASSIRDNSYQIPDVIKFHHPSFTSKDDKCNANAEDDDEFDNYDISCDAITQDCGKTATGSLKGGLKSKNRISKFTSVDGIMLLDTLHTTTKDGSDEEKNDRASVLDTIKPERECFDLYLSNPFLDRELQIMEALVSRPEYVSVQFDPGRMASPDLTMLLGSGPSQVVRQWTLDGPLYVPPESEHQYILSICTAFEGEIERDEGSETYLDEMSKWIDSGDPTRNLGFLQIRTDAETLFIGLEHADTVPFLSLQTGEPSRGELPSDESSSPSKSLTPSIGTNQTATSSTLLRSLPDRLDFEMISTTSPAIRASFGLQNKSPVPIRIMRVSVGIDSAGDKENAKDVENIGLELKVAVKKSAEGVNDVEKDNGDNLLASLILGAASSLDDLFEITCSLNPDRFFSDTNKEEFTFNGTVIIRGTMDTELSYNQWREETLQNPYRDEHLTLELPFTVSILNGRVEALIERSSHPYPQLFARSGRAVSHLFFPMNQYAAMEGSEDALPQQTYFGTNEIRHDLRILSNMNVPLKLVGAKIKDDDPDETDSLCSRFNVSTAPPINSEDASFGFEDIGLLSVRYKFGTKGKRVEKHQEFFPDNTDPLLPKECSMVVTTNPDEVGTFQIPLLIFPGRLELSSVGSSEGESFEQNKALLGFGHLLSWSRSSRLGKAFIETLHLADDRRKPKSDSHILSKFILDKFGRDSISKPKFLPILLKMGAIDSGKVSKMNLHLTNHNPIPLSVSIDVGEIEGMSITLSRDESQATGDGNSLIDHLPKGRSDALVQLGGNKDHPVAGLLDFLTSNEQALEFLSKFNFRDSITLDEPAVQNSDVLQLLHDWHSRAFFYRDSVSKQTNSKYPSKCEGNQHPPDYSYFTIYRKAGRQMIGDSSPFIFSSDKRLAHSLTDCWRQDQAEKSSETNTIKIPPGASARFEVLVRTPPHQYLKDDISHLMMSGLTLSTNLGDVMPIFAVVEALQGHLQASTIQPADFQETNQSKEVMSVPLQFSWNDHRNIDTKQSDGDAITIPRVNTTETHKELGTTYHLGNEIRGHGVPLYLRSSFSRDVRLLDVGSCNPWFSFVPLESTGEQTPSSGNGTLVGFIRTDIDCSSGAASQSGFPSYYQCVLNWFSNRSKLQPEGCGRKDSNLNLRKIDSVKRAIEVGLRRLKKSHKSAAFDNSASSELSTLSWNQTDLSHIKTGRRKNDGVISDLASYNAIGEALKIANELGYNLLSSSFEATIEYDPEVIKGTTEETSNISAKQNLSLSIHDLEVETVLRAPKLLDSDNAHLEFEPTVVGSVARSFLSVRNPTGVPVRIRLGIAPTPDDSDGIASIQPYVQNGKSSVPTNESTAFSWWDGNGAFFTSDEQGDVIRSHNNISVTGGGGTTSISLVNPSLNSQVGFLVGCGKRCGLRDKNNANSFLSSPMSSSPIGASAAAGATLKGNVRYDSPELNNQDEVEHLILAGDTSVSTIDAPAAFAIPFSALDETVIPPFGKGQLGPVYFRPPGRHNAVGCNVAKQSGARLKEEKEMLCQAQQFDSVVYLENSLTGIEEVRLRGKSTWDHLYFVDPPPEEGKDAFGDIEFRDGMPTLLFSGTSNTDIDPGTKNSIFRKSNQHLSVVKEIILHNGGDATSKIASVSLLGAGMGREQERTCSQGSFRLLNCWDSNFIGEKRGILEANINAGFVLKPGESRSLFVEHVPDCGSKKEFVNLHVHLSDDNSNSIFKTRRSRTRGVNNPFRKSDVTIAVGYQMDISAFSQCVPVDTRLSSSVIHKDTILMNHANYTSRVELKSFDNGKEESPVLLFQVLLFSSAALLLCYALHARFHAILAMLQKIQGEPTRNIRNWNAAFRCLARSHPTSTELQTMSREQMRQDVIGRYKAKGNTPSSSLNSTNGFSRDRRAAMAKTSRHRTGKEGGANERTRPFSDALFHDTSVADHSSLRIHFPAGLGWRTAYSRGIIKDNSLQSTAFSSRSKALLDKRAEMAFEKDGDVTDQSADKIDNAFDRKENKRQNSAFPVSKTEHSNGTKSVQHESESLGITSVVSMESQESKVEGHHTNGEEWKKKGKSNQARAVLPTSKEVESKMLIGRKDSSNKQAGKTEKPNLQSQPSKNTNTTEVSKRPQKNRNNSSKSTDSGGSSKVDASSKNAPLGPNQKQKPATKLTSPTSLPKGSARNAWEGERQKSDTKSSAKNDATRFEKKPREKDKSKKKVSKPTNNGKKSAKASEADSELSKAKKANPKQKKPPVVSPPPGFGAPKTKTPASPSANIQLQPVSTTDSQLSLDTMLQADLSLPSHPPSTQLPFRNVSSGGNDLLFPSSISESNTSPTKHATPLQTENTNILPSSVDQPWLPTLLNEEPEQVEQPWLPALRNEDAESGFDVMDFLDGILQDGSSADPEPMLEAESSAQGPQGGLGVAPAGNSSTPVSANPWARESRAAAYGISFDDDDVENGNDNAPSTELEDILLQGSPPPGLGGNFPLLTPAAILSAEGNNNNVDVDEDDRAMSFYAGLIDE